MQANNTPGKEENKSKGFKSSVSDFSFVKDSLKYLLTFKNKSESIEFNVRRVLGTCTYEAVYSLDDLKATSKIFYIYNDLDEIYEHLQQKLNEGKVEFSEDDDKFSLKFEFIVENKKMKAAFHLNKTKDADIVKLVDDLCKVLVSNSDTIKELQDNIPRMEDKLNKHDEIINTLQNEKNETYEKTTTKHQEKIVRLDEILTEIQEKFAKNQEEQQGNIRKHEETISKLEETISEQNETITKLHKIISSQDEKFDKLQEIIAILEEKNLKHDENFKIVRKIGYKKIEFSKIISAQENIDLIKKWIDETKYNQIKFKLLYRGTEDGKAAQDFHTRCDKKGPTLTIIKTTTKRVFGGFTMLEWESPSSHTYKANDPKAFVFSIDEKKKLSCHDQNKVIFVGSSWGPIFGGENGTDIYISNNWNSSTCSICGSCYGKNEGITSRTYLLGNTESPLFTPEEVEVYSVLNL